ncbi:MAG: hypothetical protein Q8P41_32465 [Pseudomonadota bacterium]|nr:hypothetical protein [Pseudomonadota bacterium]
MHNILIALLALTTPSAFADSKVIPGSMCRPTTSTYASSFAINSSGMAYNTSSASDIYVQCPFLDDGPTSTDSVTLYTVDYNSSYAVECTLYSRTLSSMGTYDYSSDASVGSSSTVQTLSMTSVSSTHGTHYEYLYCKIPRASGSNYSGTVAYRTNES